MIWPEVGIRTIFTEIFPDREVPVYLRADTSDSKFKNEVKRQRNEYVEGEKSKHKTRSGVINKI